MEKNSSGPYKCKLDYKRRLKIPKEILLWIRRERIDEGGIQQVLSDDGKSVNCYPHEVFPALLYSQTQPSNPNYPSDIDSYGRITINRNLKGVLPSKLEVLVQCRGHFFGITPSKNDK